MLINSALAQTSQSSGGQGIFIQLLPLLLIFVVFYFLLIRPQQKRAKEHQEMISSLTTGKVVITQGGIIAKIVKVDDENTLTLEITTGVHIKIRRDTIQELIDDSKGSGGNKKVTKQLKL